MVHDEDISDIVVDKTDKYLYSICDRHMLLCMWDIDDLKLVKKWTVQQNVIALCLSYDNSSILLGSFPDKCISSVNLITDDININSSIPCVPATITISLDNKHVWIV